MKEPVRQTVAVARRILIELWRTRRTPVFWVVFPALMLLLFGLIYAGHGQTARSFDTVAPGILIGAALFFSCLGGPVSVIVGERERHTMRRLLLGLLIVLLSVASFTSMGFFFGARFTRRTEDVNGPVAAQPVQAAHLEMRRGSPVRRGPGRPKTMESRGVRRVCRV